MQETQVWSLSREDPPGEGNGNPLQYSCLENPMDRGGWRAIPHGVAEGKTQLSTHTHTHTHTHTPPLKQSLTFSAAIALSSEVSPSLKPRIVFFLTSSTVLKWLRTSAPCGRMPILPPCNLPELQPSCKSISTHPVCLLSHQQKGEEE